MSALYFHVNIFETKWCVTTASALHWCEYSLKIYLSFTFIHYSAAYINSSGLTWRLPTSLQYCIETKLTMLSDYKLKLFCFSADTRTLHLTLFAFC